MRCALIACAIAALGPAAAHAQTVKTWNVTSGAWATTSSWAGGSAAGASDTAYFSGATVGSSNATVLLGAATSVGGMSFNNAGTTTLQSNATTARALTIGTGGVSMASNAGAVTIGVSGSMVNLTLNGTQTWTNNSSSLLSVLGTINTAGSVGSDLTIGGSGATTLSGVISGAAGRLISLRKQGSGALTLSGANSFTGGFTLSSGTVILGNASALGGSTNVVTISGGAIDVNSALTTSNYIQNWNNSFTFLGSNTLNLGTGAVTLGANSIVTVNASTLTVGGAIGDNSNAYGLTKNGAGTLVLGGANTFSGGVTLSQGSLIVGSTSALGTGTLTITSGTLDANSSLTNQANNAQNWNGNFAFAGSNALNLGTGAVTLGANSIVTVTSNTLTVGGAIGDSSNAYGLTKAGAGTLALTGNNTFTGLTTISDGTLFVGNGGTSGALTGNVLNNAALVFNRSNDATYAGNISGSGGLTKSGTGTLALSGSNSYTGATTVNAGMLQVAGTTALYGGNTASWTRTNITTGTGATLAVNVGGAGEFDANAVTILLAGVGGTVSSNGLLAGSRVGLDTTNATGGFSFGGTIADTAGTGGGNVGFIKLGSGSLTLSGSNSYSGGTTLREGTLIVGNTNALGSTSNRLTINSGTLNLNGYSVSATVLSGSSGAAITTSVGTGTSTLTVNSGSFAGVIADNGSGAVALAKGSAGALTLSASNSFSGGSSFVGNGGAIILGHNSSLGTGLVSMAFPTVLQASTTLTDVKNNFRLSGVGVGGVPYTHTVSGSNSITITGTLEVASSNTLASNLSTGNTLTLGDVRLSTTTSSGTLTVSGSGNTTFAGVIRNGTSSAAVGSLTITNTGTTTLSGANTFTGNIVASGSGGRLVIGGAGQLSGTTGTYAGSITGTNVTFDYASSANSILAGAISGTMPLLKTGAGTLTLSGTNTFAGGVTLAAGRLVVGSTSAFGTGALTITGGSLDASASLTNQGNNAQNWNGDFTFVGSNPLDVGTGAVSLGGNRTVTVTSSTLTVGGVIDDGVNTFGLTKAGPGTLVLGGANTFHGGMTVGAGTLQLGSSSALPTSSTLTLGTGSTAGMLSFNGYTATLGAITFNGSGSQLSGTASGGKLNLLAGGTANATITVTSGSHALHPDTTLQSNTVIDLAAGSYFSLHGDIDGSKSLTQIGSGTMAIYGANSYSGGTYLGGGYLSVENTGALGSGTVTIDGNSILNLNNTILTNTVVFGSGSGAIINSGTLVNVTGTYSVTSGTGTSITTNYSVLPGGDISFVNSLASTVFVQGTAVGTFSADVLEAGTVIVEAGGRGLFSGSMSGNVTTSGSSLFSGHVLGNVTVGGGTATFSSATGGASAINVNSGLGVITGTVGNIAHATAAGATLEIGGRVLSTADINAEAGGTVRLTGSQAFDGTTIENDGAVIVDRSASLALAAVITGSGSLTKSDATTLTLAGNNTFTGLTTISGGTLAVGNGGTSGALVGNILNNATLVFNRSNDAAYAGNISGSGRLMKLGAGKFTLSGSSSHSGGTTVEAGLLAVNGQIGGNAVVLVGGTLGGSGSVGGVLSGAGLVSPGNSPGILTANQFDPSGGLDAAFEFTTLAPIYTSSTASLNDVMRLTTLSNPFASGSFTAGNVIDIYFNVDAIMSGQIYEGGFFTGLSAEDLFAALDGKATFNYWAKTTSTGERSFNGFDYVSLTSLSGITGATLQTASRNADFGSGVVTGSVTQFVIVPEPDTLIVAGIGIAMGGWSLWKRRRIG